MKRVALICKNESQAGGANTYEDNLTSYLVNHRNSQIEFIRFVPNKSDQDVRLGEINFYKSGIIVQVFSILRSTLPKSWAQRLPGLLAGDLAKKLNENAIDLAYFLSPNPLALGLFSIPVVTTVWDLGHRELRTYPEIASFGRYTKREYYYSRILVRCSLIVTESETTASRISDLYKVDTNKILHAGLFPKGISNCDSIDEIIPRVPYPYLIYPAQFWAHKNHLFLLEVMSDLQSKFPSLKLVLTGSDKGQLGLVKRRIQTLQLDENVEILGYVDNKNLRSLISNARALVFPSLLGPTNLPPLESLILGTPVVVTDKNSDLTHDPANGVWVVCEDSKEDYIESIATILSSKPEFKPWSFENMNIEFTQKIIFRIKSL